MDNVMQDPMSYYTIAFVIFMALAFKFGRKPALGWVDAEINKIRDELEQAHKLRVEAEALLEAYKKKRAEAMAEADAIMKHAQAEAARLKQEAEADLKDALARHEQQASERIRLAEIEAAAAVRAAAIEMAMHMARKALAGQIDSAAAAKLADKAIADLPVLAAAKSKAA